MNSATRKSIFDSILGGCVPVIFARASLGQYNWFLSEREIESISVFISKKTIVQDGVNFLDILTAIPGSELRKKQLALEKIAPKLQYSVVPNDILQRSEGVINKDNPPVWDPPLVDAADIIINKILDRNTIEPLSGFTDSELGELNCMQNSLTLKHPDYAGLFHGTQHLTRGRGSDKAWSRTSCREYNYTNSTTAFMSAWYHERFNRTLD